MTHSLSQSLCLGQSSSIVAVSLRGRGGRLRHLAHRGWSVSIRSAKFCQQAVKARRAPVRTTHLATATGSIKRTATTKEQGRCGTLLAPLKNISSSVSLAYRPSQVGASVTSSLLITILISRSLPRRLHRSRPSFGPAGLLLTVPLSDSTSRYRYAPCQDAASSHALSGCWPKRDGHKRKSKTERDQRRGQQGAARTRLPQQRR
ncbi:hypothetical protein BJY59DRAFT_41658 [Rhodotorula toruloides]